MIQNKWRVTSDYIKGSPSYIVTNSLTGERKGFFDCEKWAQEMADELNREADDDRGRSKASNPQ